jgi:hypothetical protein
MRRATNQVILCARRTQIWDIPAVMFVDSQRLAPVSVYLLTPMRVKGKGERLVGLAVTMHFKFV